MMTDAGLDVTPRYLKGESQLLRGVYLRRLANAAVALDTAGWLRALREYHTYFGGQIEPELVVPAAFFAGLAASRHTASELMAAGHPMEPVTEMTFRTNTTVRPPRGDELEAE